MSRYKEVDREWQQVFWRRRDTGLEGQMQKVKESLRKKDRTEAGVQTVDKAPRGGKRGA